MKLEDIKEDDYLYYTERGFGSNYADSLIHVRLVDGVLFAHPICTNYNGTYINETPENWGEDLPVSAFFDESCWHATSYTPDDDPAKWMSVNYPINAECGNAGEKKCN